MSQDPEMSCWAVENQNRYFKGHVLPLDSVIQLYSLEESCGHCWRLASDSEYSSTEDNVHGPKKKLNRCQRKPQDKNDDLIFRIDLA